MSLCRTRAIPVDTERDEAFVLLKKYNRELDKLLDMTLHAMAASEDIIKIVQNYFVCNDIFGVYFVYKVNVSSVL